MPAASGEGRTGKPNSIMKASRAYSSIQQHVWGFLLHSEPCAGNTVVREEAWYLPSWTLQFSLYKLSLLVSSDLTEGMWACDQKNPGKAMVSPSSPTQPLFWGGDPHHPITDPLQNPSSFFLVVLYLPQQWMFWGLKEAVFTEKGDRWRPSRPFPDTDEGSGESWVPGTRRVRLSAQQSGPAHRRTLCISSVILSLQPSQTIIIPIAPPLFLSQNFNQEASRMYTKGASASWSWNPIPEVHNTRNIPALTQRNTHLSWLLRQ